MSAIFPCCVAHHRHKPNRPPKESYRIHLSKNFQPAQRMDVHTNPEMRALARTHQATYQAYSSNASSFRPRPPSSEYATIVFIPIDTLTSKALSLSRYSFHSLRAGRPRSAGPSAPFAESAPACLRPPFATKKATEREKKRALQKHRCPAAEPERVESARKRTSPSPPREGLALVFVVRAVTHSMLISKESSRVEFSRVESSRVESSRVESSRVEPSPVQSSPVQSSPA